jgi:segregation and condensation protein B
MTPDELLRHLESLLFVSSEPAEIIQLAAALDVPVSEVESAIDEMAERSKWRGIRVQRKGHHVQLASSPEAAPYIEKYLGLSAVTRLSQAALETLAIIAYRQPITRPEIEVLRGVDSDGVLRTLTARQLIVEVGRLETVGHPIRYGTTFEFLRYFGLERLEQLPSLHAAEPGAVASANDGREGAPADAGPGAFSHEETTSDEQEDASIAEPAHTGAIENAAPARAPSVDAASLVSTTNAPSGDGGHDTHAATAITAGAKESHPQGTAAADRHAGSEASASVEPARLAADSAAHAADVSTTVYPEPGEPGPSSTSVQPLFGNEGSAAKPDYTANTPGAVER